MHGDKDSQLKAMKKRILMVALLVCIMGVAIIARGLFKSYRIFEIEDRVHGTFFPVYTAIQRFTLTNGIPPSSLDQLVPSFLTSIPTSPYVWKLDYKPVDVSNWIMNAHSKALQPARIYSWRSDWTVNDTERTNVLKIYHNIAVLKEQN
jgi:hypothetical protein